MGPFSSNQNPPPTILFRWEVKNSDAIPIINISITTTQAEKFTEAQAYTVAMATAAPAATLPQIAGPSSSSPSLSSSSSLLACRTKWCRTASAASHPQLLFGLTRIAPAPTIAAGRLVCHAVSDSGSLSTPAFLDHDDTVPVPVVLIDQDSDANATVVELSFGDRLGALLDTMKALKDLGLDVVKGSVTTEASVIRTKFFITRSDTGRKVENPELIEAVRLTIISNLLKYHPESSERLAMGEAWGVKPPEKKIDVDIATHIRIVGDGPKRSLLSIETADRPGLLMEIVQIINDINVSVESAEIDTEGLVAKDKFHVNYHGQALSKSLAEVLTNCLRYHLRRPITDDESY